MLKGSYKLVIDESIQALDLYTLDSDKYVNTVYCNWEGTYSVLPRNGPEVRTKVLFEALTKAIELATVVN